MNDEGLVINKFKNRVCKKTYPCGFMFFTIVQWPENIYMTKKHDEGDRDDSLHRCLFCVRRIIFTVTTRV